MLVFSIIANVSRGVPRIDRRRTISGLSVSGCILRDVCKHTAHIHQSGIDRLNCVSHAVANVARSVEIACVGGFRHLNPQELGRDWCFREFESHRAAGGVFYLAVRKYLPLTIRPVIEIKSILSYPIFDLVRDRVRTGPGNTDRIHRFRRQQIDDDPLRMQGVALARKTAGQVRIALPVAEIRARHRSVPAGGKSAMRQCICKDVACRFLKLSAADKVSALVSSVAPSPVFVPVPCAHAQFGIVSIGDWSPACRERILYDMRRMHFVDTLAR